MAMERPKILTPDKQVVPSFASKRLEMAFRRLLPYFLTNVKKQSEIESLHSIFRNSPAKVFVGGLTFDYDDQYLRDMFSRFGNIVEASVVLDRNTGVSKRFGFVVFSNLSSASAAVASMDGQRVDGRILRVSYAV